MDSYLNKIEITFGTDAKDCVVIAELAQTVDVFGQTEVRYKREQLEMSDEVVAYIKALADGIQESKGLSLSVDDLKKKAQDAKDALSAEVAPIADAPSA